VVDWLGGSDEVFPLYDFQLPNTLKASDQVPKFQHKVDKAKFHEEIRNKPLTIEDVIALAPKISSSDDDGKQEGDSW
jgi:hypothetical protein